MLLQAQSEGKNVRGMVVINPGNPCGQVLSLCCQASPVVCPEVQKWEPSSVGRPALMLCCAVCLGMHQNIACLAVE